MGVTSMSSAGGGGINMEALTVLNMSGGYVNYNRSYNSGGGVNARGAIFSLVGGTIDGNSTITPADGNGGGIHLTPGNITRTVGVNEETTTYFTTLTISGGYITNNSTHRHGGGIHSYRSTINMLPGASGQGGTISYNVADINGININAGAGGTTTGMTGGGISFYGLTSIPTPPAPHPPANVFTMYAGTISNNGRNAAGTVRTNRGGGVFIGRDARFIMHGGYIYGNEAVAGGGGVYLNPINAGMVAVLNMYGGTIGGPRGCDANCDCLPGDCILDQGNTAYNGGGVWVGNGARFNMDNYAPAIGPMVTGTGTIVGNDAIFRGGGVYVTGFGTEFRMTTGTIESNSSVSGGGGVQVVDGAQFFMTHGGIAPNFTYGHIFNNDVSSAAGGGVELRSYTTSTQSAIFTMSAGIIGHDNRLLGNSAFTAGGGVSLQLNPTDPNTLTIFNMLEPISETVPLRIVGNRSYGVALGAGGGGIENNNGIINMHAGIIENNRSLHGAGVYLERGIFYMHGGIIRNHHYNATDGDIEIGGGVKVGNSADPARFTMTGGFIYSNSAIQGGGVRVFNTNSDFIMTGGTIGGPRGCDEDCDTCPPGNDCIPDLGNTADYGGGVWVGNNALFSLRGTAPKNIIGNNADDDGGGVWVADAGTIRMETTVLHPAMDNVSITHNTAGHMGGGIFTERHEYASPLTRYTGSPLLGAQTVAYSNLTLHNIVFNYNRANRRYVPPTNATAVLPNTIFAGSTTSQPANAVRIHPLNNYDINFRIPGHDFIFNKTNHLLYNDPPQAVPLQGARFRVFRTDIDPTLANLPINSLGLIIFDPTGAPNSPWEEVEMIGSHISSDMLAVPLGFEMIPGFTYQLVEYMAPSGFRIPFGQWRMWQSNPLDHTIISFQDVDTAVPVFLQNNNPTIRPELPTGRWFVGNMPDFELPLTGGLGSGAIRLTMAGAGVLTLALAYAAVPIFIAKAKKQAE